MPPTQSVVVHPATSMRGRVRPPGDKSISHRYALLAAIADGASLITEDQFFALQAMRNVFVNLVVRIGDRRAMAAEQNRQIRQSAHAFQRIKILAHIPFRRVDQNRSVSDDIVAGKQTARAFVVKA